MPRRTSRSWCCVTRLTCCDEATLVRRCRGSTAPCSARWAAAAALAEPVAVGVAPGGLRDFPEADPDLLKQLLPPEWSRPRARRCFVEIYDLLGPLAELRFRQIVAESHPELAAHVSHHDSATVARLYAELGDGHPRGDTPFERAAEAAAAPASGEPEHAGGVVLEDQRSHLVLDVELGEVGEPAVGVMTGKTKPKSTLRLSRPLATHRGAFAALH